MISGYKTFFARRPLMANMISTGILFGTGDALAQICFPQDPKAKYDYLRTMRAVIYGGAVFGPIGNRLYKFVDTIKFPLPWQPKRLYDTIARVSFDQLVWAPIGIPLYYSCITLMEGYGIPEIKAKLREVYLDTLINNWKVWPLFQAFNFWFTPVRYRLLAVNIISIVWNCYLSIENQMSNAKVEHSEQ